MKRMTSLFLLVVFNLLCLSWLVVAPSLAAKEVISFNEVSENEWAAGLGILGTVAIFIFALINLQFSVFQRGCLVLFASLVGCCLFLLYVNSSQRFVDSKLRYLPPQEWSAIEGFCRNLKVKESKKEYITLSGAQLPSEFQKLGRLACFRSATVHFIDDRIQLQLLLQALTGPFAALRKHLLFSLTQSIHFGALRARA